jgi:alkylhydroperoxidase family enzyme
VEAVLEDPANAPVSEKVRAGLRIVQILTLRPDELGQPDLDVARAAGLDDTDIRDAALVCTLFSIITRLADTLDFHIPDSFDATAKSLVSRGYRIPAPVLFLPRT